jgi:DNA-binding NtrC family response regulator
MHVNLLIIDDNADLLESMILALKTKGITAILAKSAKEALVKLNADLFEIDMVVTDYAMPEMNGLELLESIRKRDPHLPVIIMTAYGEKELLAQALRLGCNGYIEKPFTPDQLILELERIASMLKRRGNRKAFPNKIFQLIDTINDKLADISGNIEFAMIGLAFSDPESTKTQLNLIGEVSQDISHIGKEILKLVESPEV